MTGYRGRISKTMSAILDQPGGGALVRRVASTGRPGVIQVGDEKIVVFTRKAGQKLRLVDKAKRGGWKPE